MTTSLPPWAIALIVVVGIMSIVLLDSIAMIYLGINGDLFHSSLAAIVGIIAGAIGFGSGRWTRG